MNKFVITLALSILYSTVSLAEYRNIDEIMTEEAQRGTSLIRLLEDIQLQPTNEKSQRNLMKVIKVAPGSVYEKAGIRSGDFVISKKMEKKATYSNPTRIKTRRANSPQKSIELYQKLEPSGGGTPGVSSVSFKGQKLNGNELSIYKRFNLKKGDTIVMFNGRPLSSPQDAMALYTKLKKNEVSQLLIHRDNSFEFLSVKK